MKAYNNSPYVTNSSEKHIRFDLSKNEMYIIDQPTEQLDIDIVSMTNSPYFYIILFALIFITIITLFIGMYHSEYYTTICICLGWTLLAIIGFIVYRRCNRTVNTK